MISDIAQQIFGGQPTKPEKEELPSEPEKKPEIPGIHSDDAVRLERVAIMAEDIEPKGPRLFSGGKDLGVHEGDPPHIRVYAWCLVNLNTGRPLSVDIDSTARILHLSPREVRTALSRLVKDGDLVRTMERGRELFRLNIQYGGTHE
jgi:hypothetical protein